MGRQLGRDEFVCHHDDDPGNNWPGNLSLDDHASNVADSLRNGRQARIDYQRWTTIKEAQVCEIRLALARGERVGALAKDYGSQEYDQPDPAGRAAEVISPLMQRL